MHLIANFNKNAYPVGCVPPAHLPYLVVSHACPPQPRMPPPATTHAPPATTHAPPQPRTPCEQNDWQTGVKT